MPQHVDLPDGRVAEFPDGMSSDEIYSAINSMSQPAAPAQSESAAPVSDFQGWSPGELPTPPKALDESPETWARHQALRVMGPAFHRDVQAEAEQEGGAGPLQLLRDLPGAAIKYSAGAVGKALQAGTGRLFGSGDTTDDWFKSVVDDKPLPVEEAASKLKGVGGVLARGGLGIEATIPKLAMLAAFPESLLAQSIAAGGIFGFDDQGNFSPKSAIIGALMPGVGKVGTQLATKAIASALEGGAKAFQNPAAQWFVEELGQQAALNALLLAGETPELIQLYKTDPEAAKHQIQEIVGQNLAWALFGGARHFLGKKPTATQQFIAKNKEKYGDIADTMITRQMVGKDGQQAIEAAIEQAKARQFGKFGGGPEGDVGGAQGADIVSQVAQEKGLSPEDALNLQLRRRESLVPPPAEPTAPPAPEVVPPVEPVNPSGAPAAATLIEAKTFRPALLIDGNAVWSSGMGWTHKALMDEAMTQLPNPEIAIESFANEKNHVFVDEKGTHYTREQAAKILGEKEPLTSQRLAELQGAELYRPPVEEKASAAAPTTAPAAPPVVDPVKPAALKVGDRLPNLVRDEDGVADTSTGKQPQFESALEALPAGSQVVRRGGDIFEKDSDGSWFHRPEIQEEGNGSVDQGRHAGGGLERGTIRRIGKEATETAVAPSVEPAAPEITGKPLPKGITEADGLLYKIVGNIGKIPIFLPDGQWISRYRRYKATVNEGGLGALSAKGRDDFRKMQAMLPVNFEDNFGVNGEVARQAYDAAKQAGLATEIFDVRKDGRNMRLDTILDQTGHSNGQELFSEIRGLVGEHERRESGELSAREANVAEREVKQFMEFDKDSKQRYKGSIELPADTLYKGSEFTIKGEKFKVTELETDGDGRVTEVTLDDGNKYGTQQLEGKERIRIDADSLKHPEGAGAVEFAGADEPPATVKKEPAKPVEKPVTSDSLLDDRYKEQLAIVKNNLEVNLGTEKPITQGSLSELTKGKPVFHETSLDNAYRVYAGLRRAINRSWTQFFVSDNPDLALGQSGKGVLFELDPSRVNGWKHNKPGTTESTGFEYWVDKSIHRAVKAITFSNRRQMEAFQKRFSKSLDYSKAESVERGIRVPVKEKGEIPSEKPESPKVEEVTEPTPGAEAKPAPIVEEKEQDPYAPGQKVHLRGQGPQNYTIIREDSDPRFPDEREFLVKNDRTGKEERIDFKTITPVKERAESGVKKPKRDLDAELRKLVPGIDTSQFPNEASKKSAIKRYEALKKNPAANLGEGLPEGEGATPEEVRSMIAGVDTADFPVEVISRDAAEQITGRPEARGYGGFFKDGKIYLVHDNIASGMANGAKALLREEVGHGLLRTPEGLRLLSRIMEEGKLRLTESERQALLEKGYLEENLLDEFIAKSGMENRPWWKEVIERVRVFLSKAGLVNLSNAEIARMILREARAAARNDDTGSFSGPVMSGETVGGFVPMNRQIQKLKSGDRIRFNGHDLIVDKFEADPLNKNEGRLFVKNEDGLTGSVKIWEKTDTLNHYRPVGEPFKGYGGGSRFSETAPGEAVKPEDEAATQVAGEKIGVFREKEKVDTIRDNVRSAYFDGRQPLSPESTTEAWELAQSMTNRDGKAAFAEEVARTGRGQMAPGFLRNELWEYAVRMTLNGDPRLLEFMTQRSQDFQTISPETYESFGAGADTQAGRVLRAAAERANNGLWKRMVVYTKEQLDFLGKKLSKGPDGMREIIAAIQDLPESINRNDLEEAVRTGKDSRGRSVQEILDLGSEERTAAEEITNDAAKGDPPEVRKTILETVYEWMKNPVTEADKGTFIASLKDALQKLRLNEDQAQTIADATWVRKTSVDGAKRRRAWDAELRRLDNMAEKTAQAFINRVDQAEWMRKEQPNEVRDIIKEALKSTDPMDSDNILGYKSALREKLMTAGLSEKTARGLADAIWQQRERDLINAGLRAREKAADSKNVKSLIESVLNTPYLQQGSKWRMDTAIEWFISNGLRRDQAVEAAKVFNAQYEAAMGKAIEAEVNKLSKNGKLKDPRTIPEMVKSIRLGLTDPSKNWIDSLANRQGFKALTPEQHQRLAELEEKLSDPNISTPEQVAIVEQMMGVMRHVGDQSGSFMKFVGESFAASLLSGFRTQTLHVFQPLVNAVGSLAAHSVFEPRDFPALTKALFEASKSWLPEFKYAWQKDAYSFNAEQTALFHNELKKNFEIAQREFKNGEYAKAIPRVAFAWQQYVIRALQSANQAGMSVVQKWKLALYGSMALREVRDSSGRKMFGTQDISDFVDFMVKAKEAEFDAAKARGYDDTTAQVIANDFANDRVRQYLNGELGNYDKSTQALEAAVNDAYSVVGRRANGVGEMDEGMLSQPINFLMKKASEARRHGGAPSILTIMALGFMNVPFRLTRYYAGWSPYGLVRSAVNKYRVDRGMDTLWKQSYKNELAARARFREAAIGTGLMLGFVGWQAFKHTSDDDAEKRNFAMYATGEGPENRTLRDAWLKRGYKPFSLNVVAGGRVVASIPITRVGEIFAYPLGMAAALDDVAWKRKQEAATGETKDFPGRDLIAGLSTYYEIVGAQGVLQSAGHLSQLGSGESGVGRALAVSAASTTSALAIPGKAAIQSLTDMIYGPVDRSSAIAAAAANFPVLNAIVNGNSINRFGDVVGDRSWSGIIGRTGIPIVFRVSDTQENREMYQMIVDKGAAPPDLRRYIVEENYGPLTQDQWNKYVKSSGDTLKSMVLQNMESLQELPPQAVREFMMKAAESANAQAAAALNLQPERAMGRGSHGGGAMASGGGGGSGTVKMLPSAPSAGGGMLPTAAGIPRSPGGSSGGGSASAIVPAGGGGSRGGRIGIPQGLAAATGVGRISSKSPLRKRSLVSGRLRSGIRSRVRRSTSGVRVNTRKIRNLRKV